MTRREVVVVVCPWWARGVDTSVGREEDKPVEGAGEGGGGQTGAAVDSHVGLPKKPRNRSVVFTPRIYLTTV